jgi:hypothetical protein
MIPKAREVRLKPKVRKVLEARCRAPAAAQRDVRRARIVLLAAEGRSTRSIAAEVGVQPRVLPLFLPYHAWRGRKPIRRGQNRLQKFTAAAMPAFRAVVRHSGRAGGSGCRLHAAPRHEQPNQLPRHFEDVVVHDGVNHPDDAFSAKPVAGHLKFIGTHMVARAISTEAD